MERKAITIVKKKIQVAKNQILYYQSKLKNDKKPFMDYQEGIRKEMKNLESYIKLLEKLENN